MTTVMDTEIHATMMNEENLNQDQTQEDLFEIKWLLFKFNCIKKP